MRLIADAIDLFLSRASATPRHPALAASDEIVSYELLEDRARRVAQKVSEYDAPKVLIALPQGTDAYAAMLGTGLGGGYYAPVNEAAPREKLALIARSYEPDLIIGSGVSAAAIRTEAPQAEVIDVGEICAMPPLAGRGRRHKLAYVIYTSGSTGVPKGVAVPRSALDHYVASLAETLDIKTADKVSQHPNIAFDLSVMDIYGALCYGATLCPIAGQGDRLMPARAVAREKVTVWISVPSVISLMMRAGHVSADNLSSVRLFVFCGEPLLKEHLDAIFSACPGAIVANTYGPTETTVSMTALRLTHGTYLDACSDSVAIGKPIAGMGLHLIGGPNPDEGEIVITGPQLALGYWRNAAQSIAAFRILEIDGVPVRAYFSGDWAKRIGPHTFVKGRFDLQVKIHGHRLELDEVCAAIRACGWPEVCVVLWRENLAAVIEVPEGMALNDKELRRALAGKLESYAIPVILRSIPRLPRNDNDKIDSSAITVWLDDTRDNSNGTQLQSASAGTIAERIRN
jgi:D-alanine--poly(phosphoribitol) ligase subunit 1